MIPPGSAGSALYLHFPTRADLFVATTRHIDEVKDVEGRLRARRTAASGRERLDAFIEAWGNYLPEIHGLARALIDMSPQDEAARLAWEGCERAVREGCRAAIDALVADGDLTPDHSPDHATDILCALLSLPTWEMLTGEAGWPQHLYIEKTKAIARRMLMAPT